ncbi:alpha/beta fold hydrolase [Sediminicurvatus halobius]|uniref:Alpha/beta hydrolase n=1 Tax=Sediminicurvatus halobius TaxID=2182432 RepID=A0A2U2MXT1_9GAMM|nr:alpha/beta hydrolase [Spiribacter halobius]PWG61831.1 alpha/beta hydrolase [Spiribacter halobius]UEX77674.1 alpha/beta hydrolase [Spiribacter halobius]
MTHFEAADRELLPGFKRQFVQTREGSIMTLRAGEGPALLMLHGDPQTHLCWHHQAAQLAKHYTVVLTDLRGRGESHKPQPGAGLDAYAKRAMAAEQLEVMRALGHDRFAVVGHDRGARVARRLALDHPQNVTRLVEMDIVPAGDFYDNTTAEIAQDYFYFFFLTQDHPIPESLIAGDPRAFMRLILTGLSNKPVPYHPTALETYLASASRADAVAAMCECFRAGFHLDRVHDAEDLANGDRIDCPTLVMWGEHGVVAQHFDLTAIWSRWCSDVDFLPMPTGHFIPEEAPEAVLSALLGFLE